MTKASATVAIAAAALLSGTAFAAAKPAAAKAGTHKVHSTRTVKMHTANKAR